MTGVPPFAEDETVVVAGELERLCHLVIRKRPVADLDIQILGVNRMDWEWGNAAMTDGRDLPWLQDVDSE